MLDEELELELSEQEFLRYNEPVQLTRLRVTGWVKFAFWGLRIYTTVMTVLILWHFFA